MKNNKINPSEESYWKEMEETGPADYDWFPMDQDDEGTHYTTEQQLEDDFKKHFEELQKEAEEEEEYKRLTWAPSYDLSGNEYSRD